MSAFVFRSKGTLASGTIALSPGAPAGKTNGDLLLLPTVTRNNGETLDPVANAWLASWTDVSAQLHGAWNHLFARYADGTALDTPTVDYTGTPNAIAQIAAFSGGGAIDLSTIVSASVDKNGSNLDTLYDALTVAQDNTLCLAVSTHNKTTASDASTYAALSPFTKIDEKYGAGTDVAFWWGYNIQTTATNFASGTHTYTGSADTLQYTSLIVSLKSAVSGAAARRRLGSTPIGLQFVRTY